jgi:hypothetical protein
VILTPPFGGIARFAGYRDPCGRVREEGYLREAGDAQARSHLLAGAHSSLHVHDGAVQPTPGVEGADSDTDEHEPKTNDQHHGHEIRKRSYHGRVHEADFTQARRH